MIARVKTGWRRLRPVVREVTTQVLYAVGATKPRRRARERLTIVTFHRVLPAAERDLYPLPNLVITPEELDALLGFLGANFLCGTLADAHSRWCAGETAARPWLALTFDDTPHDNFLHARPVLERHGLRATFFAPAGLVDRREDLWHDRLGFAVLRAQALHGVAAVASALGSAPMRETGPRDLVNRIIQAGKRLPDAARADQLRRAEELAGPHFIPDWARLMTWDELRGLADGGHEIGSHTLSHPLLPQITSAGIEDEVAGSRALLERRLERRIETFCYPNGDFDERSLAAVQRAGYRCAVTTRIGLNDRGADARQLRRVEMRSDHFARGATGMSRSRAAWRLSGWARDKAMFSW